MSSSRVPHLNRARAAPAGHDEHRRRRGGHQDIPGRAGRTARTGSAGGAFLRRTCYSRDLTSNEKTKRASKPDSVRRLRDVAIIYLGRRSPVGSSTLPAASDRFTMEPIRETGRLSLLIWACWRWGLPCHDRRRPRGALLPHHFTLTGGKVENFQTECDRCHHESTIRRFKRSRRLRSGRRFHLGGVFSVALSLGSRRVGVTNHRALPSPDFPPADSMVMQAITFARFVLRAICDSAWTRPA